MPRLEPQPDWNPRAPVPSPPAVLPTPTRIVRVSVVLGRVRRVRAALVERRKP